MWGGGVSHNDNDAYRFLAFNSDPRIIVWRLDKPQKMFTLTGHRDNVMGLAFNSDGTLLASISRDNMLCVWRITE
jgi:WD40 repeat protein